MHVGSAHRMSSPWSAAACAEWGVTAQAFNGTERVDQPIFNRRSLIWVDNVKACEVSDATAKTCILILDQDSYRSSILH